MNKLPHLVVDLCNILLDRFERPGRQAGRVIRVRLSDLPQYRQSEDRPEIHAQLVDLAARKLIELHWVKNEENNWLKAVDLNESRADDLYGVVERVPRAVHTNELLTLLEQPPSTEWLEALYVDLRERLAAAHSIAPFRLDEPGYNADLLTILRTLADQAEPCLERVFSVRLFGDSKRFELLRPNVLSLLRRYSPWATEFAGEDQIDQDGLLRAYGLQRLPEYVPISGPLILCSNQIDLDLQPFGAGLALSADLLRRTNVAGCTAALIMTVENATTYELLQAQRPADWLILFTGGFASPTVIALLRAIQSLRPGLPLLHWGDMDAGGLRILAHLRRRLGPVATLGMSLGDFDAGRPMAQPLTAYDRACLATLRQSPYLSDCAALIDRLLATGLKVEQEALDVREVLRSLSELPGEPIAPARNKGLDGNLPLVKGGT